MFDNRHAPVTSFVLYLLGGLGFYLLWGVGIENGMMAQSNKALERRIVPTDTTGIAPLDNILGILVFFFESVMANPSGRPLMSQIGSLLAVSNTVVYFAAASTGTPGVRLLVLPVLFATQAIGAAAATPPYFALLLMSGQLGKRPINARGWLFALLPTFLGLAGPVLFPILPRDLTQRFSVAWQLWPLWATILLPFVRPIAPRQSPSTVLTILGFLGAAMHLQSIAETILTWKQQVPIKLFTGSTTGTTWAATFIACDVVVTYVATILFVAATSTRSISWTKVLGTTVVAGPAAAIAWTLVDLDDSQHTKKD